MFWANTMAVRDKNGLLLAGEETANSSSVRGRSIKGEEVDSWRGGNFGRVVKGDPSRNMKRL